MASYYVWSGATGSANGTSWANAYTTLTLAFAGKAAGDIFYVAHDHAETTAGTLTLTTAGLVANPVKVICVNRAGSVPPVSADRRATAQVTTTVNGGINITGCTHYDGFIFLAGNSTGTALIALPSVSSISLRFDNCSFRIGSTGPGRIQIGGPSGTLGGTYVEWNNTTVSFSATNQGIDAGGVLKWRNTPAALLGFVQATLIQVITTRGGEIECIGVDLSAMGSGKTLVGTSTPNTAKYRFIDCKLDAAVTRMAGIPNDVMEADFVRCGAAGVSYAVSRHRNAGVLTEETTIVRTGGATG